MPQVVAELAAERDGAGPAIADLGQHDPGGSAGFDPSGLRAADRRRRSAPAGPSPTASVDFVATDPPYNIQLPLTMAGGPLAETHANRRTDYAMVSDLDGGPRQLARLPDVPRPDGDGRSASCAASCGPGATPS